MKNEKLIESSEEKRRKAAILGDRNTMTMDFTEESDPLWKRVWKTEGIRYLGKGGNGVIDAMERFEHAFMLGYRAGVSDMLGEAQWLIKEGKQ
jgi:hypothetical protein